MNDSLCFHDRFTVAPPGIYRVKVKINGGDITVTVYDGLLLSNEDKKKLMFHLALLFFSLSQNSPGNVMSVDEAHSS